MACVVVQGIAKRGHYGAFLLEEWDLLARIVSTLSKNLRVPVTCKIRLLPSFEDTLELCRILIDAGCMVLTVHGRTKEQKKDQTGPCDWEAIRKIVQVWLTPPHDITLVEVRNGACISLVSEVEIQGMLITCPMQAVPVPVIANGGIENMDDVIRCLEVTGAAGVMSSEAILENPGLFTKNFDKVTGQVASQVREYQGGKTILPRTGSCCSTARWHTDRWYFAFPCWCPRMTYVSSIWPWSRNGRSHI